MEIGLNTYSIHKEAENLASNVDDLPKAILAICNDADISKVELFDKHFRMDNVPAVQKYFDDNGIDWFAFGAHCKVLVRPNLVEEKAKEYKTWFELAHKTGIKYIRFQMDSGDMPKIWAPMDDFDEEEWEEYYEMIDRAMDQVKPSMDRILEIIDDYDVCVGLETHGSFSSNYVFMEKFNKVYNHEKIHWIYDIGNYDNAEMRFKALDELKDKTCYLHAASYKYDENGVETSGKELDYPKAAKILKESGFDGIWSIEFKGPLEILGILQSAEYCRYAFAQADGEDYQVKTNFGTNEELIKKYRV